MEYKLNVGDVVILPDGVYYEVKPKCLGLHFRYKDHFQTLDDVCDFVVRVVGDVTKSMLKSKCRKRHVADARKFFYYAATQSSMFTLMEIGNYINRNHSTVQVESFAFIDNIEYNPHFYKWNEALMKEIKKEGEI